MKESCIVNRGKTEGVCRPKNECKTVSSPKKGSCTSTSHVCCYYQKPNGADNQKVNNALRKTSVSRLSQRTLDPGKESS